MNNFEKHGFCIVKSAITKELSSFITQYALFDEMQNFSANDDQVTGAHSKYGDPAMESLLLSLQEIIEHHTKLKLFPTYSYYRVYRQGDELISHVDRPSCEISATLCFDYSYDSNHYIWPIFMEGKRVVLNPGDMVIYKGCELNHWRDRFDIDDSDAWHVQGFFHYVNSAGPFAEYKFDKRNSVGEKKIFNQIEKPYIIHL
jgi:predicted amidohydrolase